MTDPRGANVKKILDKVSGRPFHWVYLGANIGEYQRVVKTFGVFGSLLDTTEQFHKAAEKLRNPYLDLIYDIGQTEQSLQWWITSLSYRSPSTSNAFRHSCYLRVALNLASDANTYDPLVILAPRPVIQAFKANQNQIDKTVTFIGESTGSIIRRFARLGLDHVDMLAHRVHFAFWEALRVMRARISISDPFRPSQPITLLISWATPDSLSRGADFHRAFFGNLVSYLQKTGRTVAVTPMFQSRIPYGKALAAIRSKNAVPWLVPHRILTLWDIFSIVTKSCFRPPKPKGTPILDGMDVKSLTIEDLRTHWIGNGAADAMLIATMIRRIGRSNVPVERIIYTYENQPWERAMCWEARKSLPDTVLVGYQHARASKLLLNWHLSKSGEPEAPLPDHIVTVGALTADLLSKSGYSCGQLRVGGALNMEDRRRTDESRPIVNDWQNESSVLIAASYNSEETAELATIAAELYGPGDGVRVVLKFHPGTPLERIRHLTDIELPNHVVVSTDPIETLILQSSVMIYSGSTVCVEALDAALPVIHLRPRFDFDLDPLESAPNTRLAASGVNELRKNVNWLLRHREDYISAHESEWQQVSSTMYGSVDDETIKAFTE